MGWEVHSMHAVETANDYTKPLWLVDGLIHNTVTTFASPPKAGKSTAVGGIAAEMSNGKTEYLGRQIHIDGPCRTVFFTTDAGSQWEYTRRLRALGADPSMISFIDGRYLMEASPIEWDLNVKQLVHSYPALRMIVIDNLLGVMGESTPGKELNRFWLQLQDFNLYGIAVVVLNHTAVQDETGRGMGRRPQGGRSNETSTRHIVMLLPPGNKAPDNILKVVTNGNDVRKNAHRPFYVELRDRNGEPELVLSDWRPQPEKPRVNRAQQTRVKTEKIKQLLPSYEGHNLSDRQIADQIAAGHPDIEWSAETIRTKITAIRKSR